MYKNQLTLFALFFFGSALCVAFLLSRVTENDHAAYSALMESSTPADKALLSYSQQAREGVIKEIWYQERTPLYIRIASEDSQLFFFYQDERLEVIEQFESVACLMQEELFYEGEKPMQTVRYMEAKRASYNYNTQLFIGEEAKLWKYHLEGHEPVLSVEGEEATLFGTADRVEFTVNGKELDFQAHRLKASFNSKEAL